MNVSPHLQTPTKSRPGPPSLIGLGLVILVVLVIAFIVVTWVNDDDEDDQPAAVQVRRSVDR